MRLKSDGTDRLLPAAGICTMTCHKAHNVFDVVPGDVVGSVILTTAAATVQVSALHLTLLLLQSLSARICTMPSDGPSFCWMAQACSGFPHIRRRGARVCGNGQECRRQIAALLTCVGFCAQNKWADRSRPLVVHACSSTTYPYSHYNIYRDSVYPFYQQNPCKLRFTLGSYVRCCILSSLQHQMCYNGRVLFGKWGMREGQVADQCNRAA